MQDKKTKAIVKREGLSLMGWQMKKLYTPTPREEIYKREGPKKKILEYVRVGYIIKKLNEIFSPLGWDFEVLDQGAIPKSVWVKGKLTIKDHKGNTVNKTQYGQHKHYEEVPIGDAYKAAASDCLKKCASMLGIALDVYSRSLDQGGEKEIEEKENENGSLMASEVDKKRIVNITKELGAKTAQATAKMVENVAKGKVDWGKMTKNEATTIYATLLQKKINKK